MADLTLTEAQIGMVDPSKAITIQGIAAAAITAGTPFYINATTGKATAADASAAGTAGVRGIATTSVGAGSPVTGLRKGGLYGFDLSGEDYDAAIYLSDTAGKLADAAGTVSVVVGRVLPLTDQSATKVLWVDV